LKGRILAASATALGVVLFASAPASAHNTDDWYLDRTSPGSRGYYYVGDESSHVSGVYQEVDQWGNRNNYAAIQVYVEDTSNDGYCATAQLAYTHGGWESTHWHFRTAPVYDCSTNGAGKSEAYFYTNSPIGNLHARACHANSSGAIIHCEQNFHPTYNP